MLSPPMRRKNQPRSPNSSTRPNASRPTPSAMCSLASPSSVSTAVPCGQSRSGGGAPVDSLELSSRSPLLLVSAADVDDSLDSLDAFEVLDSLDDAASVSAAGGSLAQAATTRREETRSGARGLTKGW